MTSNFFYNLNNQISFCLPTKLLSKELNNVNIQMGKTVSAFDSFDSSASWVEIEHRLQSSSLP